MINVQEPTYGRGQRSRNNSASINYRKLAGEIPAFDYDVDKKDGEKDDTNTKFDYHQYANKHIRQVVNRTYEDKDSILQIISDGTELTATNLASPDHHLTLTRPMLITDTAASIGMKTFQNPNKPKIPISDFGKLIGMNHPVTVMDVRNQEELEGWNFGDLVDYFTDEDRMYTTSRHRHNGSPDPQRVLNQISLEFSHTPLRDKFSSPSFVRELDWIDTVWPHSKRIRGDFPRVQYYCLTSTAGCYTDFHVDFGGTSVYYHVHSGRKTFLLIPPTEKNLALYEKWLCSKNQNDIFFPDMEQEVLDGTTGGYAAHPVGDNVDVPTTQKKEKVGPVLRITVEENQTFIIPAAWIHAVYTPVDSIVVGGNFLHGLDMKLQLDVHCLETRTRVPAKFRFPSFVQLMFYAGVHYYKKMLDPQKYGILYKQEIVGLWALIQALKTWSVQPADPASVVGSVPHTMSDCVIMVRGIDGKINDCKELCIALETELERVKSGQIRPPKLKLSFRRKQCQATSEEGLLLKSNQVKGGGKKLKLKLKLSPMSPSGRQKEQVDKLHKSAPTLLSTSTRTPKRKQKKIADLASKHNLNQGIDDDAWTPGGKRLPKRMHLMYPTFNGNRPDLSIKKENPVMETSCPQLVQSSGSMKQKSNQPKVQMKKGNTIRKKHVSSVRERLKKKFGR